jgi:hypothetical protein
MMGASRNKHFGILAHSFVLVIFIFLFVFSGISLVQADVIINVLAVNPKDSLLEKNIEFSLPGEIKPEDVVDPAGLQVDYNVKDAGYFLHGKVTLLSKETKILRVRVRDVWRITGDRVIEIRDAIDRGYKEMGAERSAENGAKLRQKLLDRLTYIIAEEEQFSGGIDARIDLYRNHLQMIQSIKAKAHLIDYWRMDADVEDPNKIINYVVEVSNPTEKTKKVKQQHYLPKEVGPEYIVDRKGFEVRFDEKKGQAFLFKEEDFEPNEKHKVSIGIQDVWFVPQNELQYLRSHSKYVMKDLERSKFVETAKTLYNEIVNNLDLIESLQAVQQPDIQQHIGAYRINSGRFDQVKKDLDVLEKLLARFRMDLEKSKIKNVMQKIQQLKSLSRVSEAIFDKKPTVNAAWKLIGGVMLFLAFFTVIHFVTWFLRSSREKKQEDVQYNKKKSGSQA